MMLRSSSTPVLGSLLPSFSESPNNFPNHYEAKPNAIIHHSHNKLSFHQTGHLNLTTISSNSSPISPSVDHNRYSHKGFRRAQSEGNLAGLACDASFSNKDDQFCEPNLPNMFARRSKCLMLETIPSFSYYDSRGFAEEDEEEDESDIEDYEERGDYYGKNNGAGETLMAIESISHGLEDRVTNMSLAQEVRVTDAIWSVGLGQQNEMAAQGLYLGKELDTGGGSGGHGRGGDFSSSGGGGDEGDKQGVEEYYKRMVEENPGNPLFLGNYAQFLYQSKGDLKRAEEYYSRAILADPKDGGNLSQYAGLVWELHHDQHRATSYYERAVQASPQDSHIHAAYANFLWETEDDDEEETAVEDLHALPKNFHEGSMASATA